MMMLRTLLFLLSLASFSAGAQTFPWKTGRMVVPYPAGGTTDVLARRVAEMLRVKTGQTFVVENRPGAQTQIGVQEILKAPADGHTLLMATLSTMSLNPVVLTTLNYKVEQLAPVALVAKVPFSMDAALNFPPNSIAEVVAYAKANPGKVNIGTTGLGTSGHLIVEMFKAAAGIDVVPVHYKGGAPAIQDILGGHLHLYFDGVTSSVPHYQGKRMKLLGITSEKRMPALPDVPTFVEAGLPSVVSYSWYGVVTRAGTPDRTIAQLNQVINEFVASPEMQEQLRKDAAVPGDLSPAGFAKMIADETADMRRIVAPLNLKLD
jgi:tripartite-type tricarboxylate transporter receptor subunit TctC